jgi:hypothetical protein
MNASARFGYFLLSIIAATGAYLPWQRFGAPWLTWYSGRWKHVPARRAPEWPRKSLIARTLGWFLEDV